MDEIELQVAYGAVKHFGRNLYTTNPPAIAELVANAWDAYATNCEIYNRDEELLIIDNGIGMTDNEFSTRYAVSGFEKSTDDIRIPSAREERPYMGRKGIGKFSAFSLGEEYVIYTKSESDDSWKSVKFNYEILLVNEPVVPLPVEHVDDISEHLQDYDISLLSNLTSGTVIHITNLKRKFIKTTTENLKNILSRRFSVNISERFDFSLTINNEEVDLKSHFYDEYVEFIYFFNMELQEIKNRFPSADENFIKKIIDKDFLNDNNVSGWIGSVNKPKNLRISDELNSVGVIVYINGKLADENILTSIQNARMSNSYIVGEVNADFLQDENEDPVLSSREGLNLEIENVSNLRNDLSEVRNELVNRWNDLRASRDNNEQEYLERILENEKFKEIYDDFFNDSQRKKLNFYAQNLFDKDENVSEHEYKYYTPVLFSLVNSEIINSINVSEDDQIGKILSKLYNLFEKTDINNALRIQAHIEDRLKVIEQLSKNIDQEAIEKVFENQLATNPWLISPFYDKASSQSIIETQEYYKTIIDNEEVEGYSDIIIRTSDWPMPIVVELKREKKTSYSAPKAQEIISQITKYRTAIMKKELLEGNLHAPNNIADIKAYFICGQEALMKLEPYERTNLEVTNKIHLVSYQRLISQAKGMYMDILDDELVLKK